MTGRLAMGVGLWIELAMEPVYSAFPGSCLTSDTLKALEFFKKGLAYYWSRRAFTEVDLYWLVADGCFLFPRA